MPGSVDVLSYCSAFTKNDQIKARRAGILAVFQAVATLIWAFFVKALRVNHKDTIYGVRLA